MTLSGRLVQLAEEVRLQWMFGHTGFWILCVLWFHLIIWFGFPKGCVFAEYHLVFIEFTTISANLHNSVFSAFCFWEWFEPLKFVQSFCGWCEQVPFLILVDCSDDNIVFRVVTNQLKLSAGSSQWNTTHFHKLRKIYLYPRCLWLARSKPQPSEQASSAFG